MISIRIAIDFEKHLTIRKCDKRCLKIYKKLKSSKARLSFDTFITSLSSQKDTKLQVFHNCLNCVYNREDRIT